VRDEQVVEVLGTHCLLVVSSDAHQGQPRQLKKLVLQVIPFASLFAVMVDRVQLDSGHRVVFDDPRPFGTGHRRHSSAARDAYLRGRIGVEPFTPEFTAAHLFALTRGRRAPIKAFVLDQRRVAGVGNIYADEALFRAGVHPLRAAGALTPTQWQRLRDAVESALSAGIEAKGASIDDFRHLDGARGSFQDRFLVHRRAGEPCPVCGREIVKIVVGGRGTYVCEHCQARPRRRRAAARAQTGTVAGVAAARKQAAVRRPSRGIASGGEQL